ncbi:MAG: NADH-quinone oxidoreductase subunit 5 family protein [Candidatus Limnocylindrales bacterium]
MTVLAPPLAALVLALALARLGGRPRALGPVAVGGLMVVAMLGVAVAAAGPAVRIAWSPSFSLTIAAAGFGRVMVVLVPAIATPVVAYAASSGEEDRPRLLSLLAAFVAAMLLLVLAADFVSLLIGWELVGAVSWALIGHGWRDRSNVEAATQAFLTTRLGDLGLYAAAGATFAATGAFAFDGVGAAASPWREIIAGGVLLAAAAKSAQVPFSPWLFAAMAGPTPVSALLHSATLVSAGAYLLIRLAPSLAAVPWFLPAVLVVGLTTTLSGGVVAAVQQHGKRVLAASTSSQYGLMFLAVGAGSTAAASAQLVTHAVFKALLFLVAGIAIHATGTPEIRRWRLGRALPVPALVAAVGALALAGVPPLGAAWSKEAIVSAAVAAGPVLGGLAFGASFLTAVYAGRFLLLAYGPGDPGRAVQRPGRVEVAAVGVLAAATVALAVLWLPQARSVVQAVTGGPLPDGAAWEVAAAVAVLAAGGAAVLVLDRRGLLAGGIGSSSRQEAVADWLGLPSLTSRLVVRPTLALSRALARADDRVIDAGVRAAARLGRAVSALAASRIDLSIDGVVTAAATGGVAAARFSRRADDSVVDRSVEGAGRAVGEAGHQSRRLQTGLTHHYYVIGAVGVAAIAVLLAAAR